MTYQLNDHPLDWQAAAMPQRSVLSGRFVHLEPLQASQHGDDLWHALQGPESDPKLWDYLAVGPFPERAAFDAWLHANQASSDPLFYSVIDNASQRAVGLLSYLRINPEDGTIEIGHISFGKVMQRSPSSTETLWLLANQAMTDLGYRRLEWKCNAQNARSMRAAERLGFVHEGIFRQHMVVKGRNRDTAWFSIVDSEWPRCRDAFRRWLDVANFDSQGQQISSLEALRRQ
ncbi:GNAT family N-acetyltransferase [Pseudomonas segetis]|uniref:Protein N-acetyltransferase, RimJ/RimL family n=1 Tax=Pseudomonas segetis TaxID=298908 RepID=A0A239CG35_9PSED|nr:GNAT family protein [Pseudomonas segetis]SNS18939.1 Protein N-acetyltransferase, RimJ/RimL family [Pseudomonas segetis]